MTQITGAEAFVRLLQRHGVKHIFGLCGDTSLPFYDALARLDHGMLHVLTRDERSAAYMADGYARVSGRVGVCEGPSGGGATYILPGVVEANESSVPLLCVTSDISVSARGHFALTELDQLALFKPVTKWNAVLDRAADIPGVLDRAFAEMTTGRPGAVHIGLPYDVQKQTLDAAALRSDAGPGDADRPTAAPADAIAQAALLLAAARRPLFIVGGGAIIAGAESVLTAIAEHLGAPVATTISGKGTIPDSHPLAVGVVGSNGGTPPTRAVVEAADLVMFIGCRAGSVTTERWHYPAPGKVKVIHLDVDERVIGANYPTDVALVGDARLTLSALNDDLAVRLAMKREGWGAPAAAKANQEKFAAFRPLAESNEMPIRPERVVAELNRVLPSDAIVVADPGTPCPYFSAYYRSDAVGRHYFSNRAHGALGYSMSAAVGAHFGRPGARVVSVMGDGSFGFTCGELETITRLRVPLLMVVISNSTYGWIKAGQKTGFGGRYFSVDFSRTDHAAVAAAFGVRSYRVEDPAKLRGVLASAAQAAEPVLVDVICQPLQDARAPVSEWIA